MASSSRDSGGVTRRRRQSRRSRNMRTVLDDPIFESPSVTCIDLTASDTSSLDVIDLTSANHPSIMDSPVVVLTSPDHLGPVTRRRGSGRRGQRRGRSRLQFESDRDILSSLDVEDMEAEQRQRASVHSLSSDESDSGIAVVGSRCAATPTILNRMPNESFQLSPEGVKISCPICLESPSQIQGSGKQVMSTTCGHIFCDRCIRAAINAQHACPTCRKKLYIRNIHPIFL